jgi:hypothetical protein
MRLTRKILHLLAMIATVLNAIIQLFNFLRK